MIRSQHTYMTRPILPPYVFPSRLMLSRLAVTVAAVLLACNLAIALAEDPRAAGASNAAKAISIEELRSDVHWLADDERVGRGILGPGLDEAAGFIAARFESLGLERLPGLETYFHHFDLPFGSELNREQTHLAAPGLRPLEVGVEFMPLAWSTPAEFEGELAFVGYGISSERYNYDDFAGIDVTGKVVLAFRHEPHDEQGRSRFTNTARPSREAALWAKARAAERAGAVALLVVEPPMHREQADVLMDFGRGATRAGIPVMHIKRATAQSLLRQSGLPNLRRLQEEIDSTGEPASKPARRPLVVSGGFEADALVFDLKNVVGVVPGKKADEYIVVGAHYDHVGMGEYGSSYGRDIHNGADDNASGTTVLMALAGAFARNPEKPERSIIFIAFTAEEIGLVGSRRFVEDAPVPLEQIVAMVNLDMVGRVRENRLFVGGWNAAEAFPEILRQTGEASPLELQDMGDGFSNRSDHFNFVQKEIPAIFFFSGLHEEYHSPRDTADLINYEGLEQVALVAYEVIEALAVESRERLAFNRPQPREVMRGRRQAEAPPQRQDPETTQRRARLGVMPDFAGDAEGEGLRVASVIADSPAARAGIQGGDVILKIGERQIRTLQDLQDLLIEAEPGQKMTVILQRDGQRQELEVTFEEALRDAA